MQGTYLERAAATNWHLGLHLFRPRNKNADVYNSLVDGTVHRSCWINTLVMYYCFSLPCGSLIVREDDVNETVPLFAPSKSEGFSSDRYTPIKQPIES